MKQFDPVNYRIFECLTGSKLYGTDTLESDNDFRGICIPPMSVLLDPFMDFDQKDSGFKEEDRTIYALGKFFKLCAGANPNIIELLFVPKENIIYKTSEWDRIIVHRDLFLSKKIKYTFTGYAFSQLKAIENHRQWFVNPPKEKPHRKMFNLTDSPIVSGENLDNSLNIPMELFKNEYYDELLREREYRLAKKKWDNYISWRDNRNPKRRELEDRFGYDCYTEETEFLTNKGWLKYKDVTSNNLLGTINTKNNSIEFQKYNNRFSYILDDYIYNIKTQVTHCKVTGNHKLYISDMHRSRKNNFSRIYNKDSAIWYTESVENIIKKRRSHYYSMNYPNNFNKEYNVLDDYLRIMGLYVSDGCLLKRSGKKKTLKGISISQLESPNKIKHILDEIKEYKISRYSFFRKGRNELTYNIYNKILAKQLLNDCNEYAREKSLPYWIINLSKRQANILLDAMIAGDGTHRKFSRTYFTISKNLADKTQLLALLSGYFSKIWHYNYPNHFIYQVYISQYYGQYGVLNKNKISREKYKGKVVCFSVPNSTLITRLNGECAFHGNCKHASHLIRLMTEGKELLLTGKIIFPLQNADEIKSVKNGKYSYEEIIELAKTLDKEFETWYDMSLLSNKPDRKALKKLYLDIIKNYE